MFFAALTAIRGHRDKQKIELIISYLGTSILLCFVMFLNVKRLSKLEIILKGLYFCLI